MKILIFNTYYYPEKASSLYLNEDIYQTFIKAGNEIVLYCPTPCRGIDKETRKKYKKIKNEYKYDGKLIIKRFGLFKEPKSTFWRFVRYYFLTWKFFFKGLFTKADIIFSQSTPPIIGLALSKLKFWKRIPIIYNLQDIFPDSLVNTGLTHKGSLLWRIGRRIENKTYRCADKIVVISEDFKNNITSKGVKEEKIVLIPNWVNIDDVYYVSKKDNPLFDKYHLSKNKFYISYSGNIGFTQNMDLLLNAAKLLNNENPNIAFVIVGEGTEKKRIQERIINESIANVFLLPFQDYKDIPYVFSLGDVGLIISKKGVGTNSVPSKTWSYMATARPLLISFDEQSELSNLIKETGSGIVSDADDLDGFIANIIYMFSNKEKLKKMGNSGYEYVLKELNKEICVAKYVDVLNKTLGSNNE